MAQEVKSVIEQMRDWLLAQEAVDNNLRWRIEHATNRGVKTFIKDTYHNGVKGFEKDHCIPANKTVNVAARNLMVVYDTRLGSAAHYGNTAAKIISINLSHVVVRPIHPEREFGTGTMRFNIDNMRHTQYDSGWGTYRTFLDESQKIIRDLYQEIFGITLPPEVGI